MRGTSRTTAGVVVERSQRLRRRNLLPSTPINSRLCTHRGSHYASAGVTLSAPKYGWVRLSTGTCRGQGPVPFREIIPLPLRSGNRDEVRSKGDVNGGR